MDSNEVFKKRLRRGDKELFHNEFNGQYYRHSLSYNESSNGTIEIITKLSPMIEVVGTEDGENGGCFIDLVTVEYDGSNPKNEEKDTMYEVIVSKIIDINIINNKNNNNEGEAIAIVNEPRTVEENNNNEGEAIVIVTEASTVEESPLDKADHKSSSGSKINNKRKRNSPRAVIRAVEVKTPKMINEKNCKKVKLATTNVTPGPQVEPMLIDEEATNVEETIIVNKKQGKASSTSKSSSKRSQYSRPRPLISTVESKTKENLNKKSKLTKSTTSNTNDEQTNNNNNPENAPSHTHDFDLGLDPKLNKQILRNIIVKKCEHLKPREQQPCSSETAVTEYNAKKKKKSKEIYVAPLNAKGKPFAHNIERAKTKAAYKNYDGIDRQKEIDEFNMKDKALNESKYEKAMKMFAEINENFNNINAQPSTSKTATTTNEFKWSYEKIGHRYKLTFSQSNKKIPTNKILELPVDPEKKDASSSDNKKNKKTKCESEDNIISDLDNLQNEEGTEVLGVFVPDDVSNYAELAKKFNVVELNENQENSSPPPVATHYFPDSPFDVPCLKVNCDLFETKVPTPTLLTDKENIKIKFMEGKLKSKERPHSYLCALFHCLRGRLVMTILTRTATSALSATFASCIAGCPTSNDIYSTWGPSAHQKKFSRDLIAIAGNIIGHRPKFMFRDILNEMFPNISAGRRIFNGRLKPREDVKGFIVYIILNAYYEAMENEWIQLELKIQKSIIDKKITIADQGKISRSALHCPNCSKSLEEIERYRFHVMQCVFNTHPDNFLRIPSLAMVASKFKRQSKKDVEDFSHEIQSHVDNNPEIDDDVEIENQSTAGLEPGQTPWKDIPRDVKVLMRVLNSEIYVCPTCNSKHPSFKSLACHIKHSTCDKMAFRHGLNICVTDDCCKLFGSTTTLRNHLTKFHVETTLTQEEKLEVIQMHKENQFICHECNNRPHKNYLGLVLHTQSSSHDKVYKALREWSICKECFETFDTYDRLRAHKKNKHPEKSEDGVKKNDNEPEADGDENLMIQNGNPSDE